MRCNKFYIMVLSLILMSMSVLLYGSFLDFTEGQHCFRIMSIPACYVAFGYTFLLLLFHVFHKMELAFLIMVGFVLSLAIFETAGYILGRLHCKIFILDIPVCYVAVVLFSLLLWLKFLQIKCIY